MIPTDTKLRISYFPFIKEPQLIKYSRMKKQKGKIVKRRQNMSLVQERYEISYLEKCFER